MHHQKNRSINSLKCISINNKFPVSYFFYGIFCLGSTMSMTGYFSFIKETLFNLKKEVKKIHWINKNYSQSIHSLGIITGAFYKSFNFFMGLKAHNNNLIDRGWNIEIMYVWKKFMNKTSY